MLRKQCKELCKLAWDQWTQSLVPVSFELSKSFYVGKTRVSSILSAAVTHMRNVIPNTWSGRKVNLVPLCWAWLLVNYKFRTFNTSQHSAIGVSWDSSYCPLQLWIEIAVKHSKIFYLLSSASKATASSESGDGALVPAGPHPETTVKTRHGRGRWRRGRRRRSRKRGCEPGETQGETLQSVRPDQPLWGEQVGGGGGLYSLVVCVMFPHRKKLWGRYVL